jgi:hypothetical protein
MPNMGNIPNQGQPNQNGGLQGEASVQSEPQLLQNLITRLGVDLPDGASIYELGDYLATGFCEPQEIDLINDYQYQLKLIRRFKRQLGIDEDQLTQMETENVVRMIMISQSSKSKGGRGVQAVRTEIVQQLRDLYEKQELGEEEKGVLDNVMGMLEGKQVVGDTQAGNYVSNQRQRGSF